MRIFFWLVVAPVVLICMLVMPASAVAIVFLGSIAGLWYLKRGRSTRGG